MLLLYSVTGLKSFIIYEKPILDDEPKIILLQKVEFFFMKFSGFQSVWLAKFVALATEQVIW